MAGFGNYNPDEGMLKADPYESFCRETMVARAAASPLDPAAANRISACATPRDLFREMAAYTQERFFSADTIAGTNRQNQSVTPLNALAPYPTPLLQPTDYNPKTGCYVQSIAGRPVRLAYESWLAVVGWGAPVNSARLSLPCIQDQAEVLVPVAVAGCAKLLEWYIPKVEVRIDNFDPGKGQLEGTLDIRTSPAYNAPLIYNGGDRQLFFLYINGGLQDWDKIKLEVKANRITAVVSKLNIRKDDKLRLELDIGGMRIRSEDFKVGEETAAITGVYEGTTRTVRLNRTFILNRHLRPGSTDLDQQYNESTRDLNKLFLENLDWAGVERDKYFVLRVMSIKNHIGEMAGLSGKLFIETRYDNQRMLPNEWLPFSDKRNGEIQAIFGTNRFEVKRTVISKEPSGPSRYVFRITGTVNGSPANGEWSVTENGTELYAGVFATKKIMNVN